MTEYRGPEVGPRFTINTDNDQFQQRQGREDDREYFNSTHALYYTTDRYEPCV